MSILRWILAPLAPFYGFVVRARNRAFDDNPQRAERVSVPVLSIGNLSVGGTGKTPLTLYLARALDEMGHPNVIISRGYGGRRAVDPMDVNPESNPYEVGDEPAMIARRLGPNRIIVGRRRAAAALRAISRRPETKLLILDDGFQHRALHRDIDLLLLDGVRTWGNGKLLPLGNLREPMTSAGRAHALVVTRGSRCNRAKKGEIEAWWSNYGSGGPVFYVDFQISALRNLATGERLILPTTASFACDACLTAGKVSLQASRGHDLQASPSLERSAFSKSDRSKPGPLFAFCALGHPESFYADLLVAGLTWLDTRSFRDHQRLGNGHIAKIAAQAVSSGAAGLVCTEKDAVKLTPAHLAVCGLPIWIAEQEVINAGNLASWIVDFVSKSKLKSAILI